MKYSEEQRLAWAENELAMRDNRIEILSKRIKELEAENAKLKEIINGNKN